MITVEDIAYIRVPVDNLDEQERFLINFGMQVAGRTDRTLYMRGAGPQPVIHISDLDSSEYRPTIGLMAASEADLETIAQVFGVPVEMNSEPGGGKIVRVSDPFGFRIELVHRPAADVLPLRSTRPSNFGVERSGYGRRNAKQHFEHSPSHVLRLGHVAITVPDCDEAFAWYSRHFNFQISDSFHVPSDRSRHMVIFGRCGLGKRFTDHHTIAFINSSAFKDLAECGFDHSAFEVLDWDDIMLGHDFLTAAGHKHTFGIGRHVAGGMVFDYWRDSAGNKIEHWADGDHVNDDYERSDEPTGKVPFSIWGPRPTPDFFTHRSPHSAKS